MGDLISRQAVINAIANTCFWLSADNWEELTKCINSIPSVENKGEWIPVSERLPEKDMLCLVAVGLLNLTQLAMYSDLMGVIDHRIFYQGDVGHYSFEDITEYVKAWIPLPEPYKKEGE